MLAILLKVVMIGYLPGALMLRWPSGDRPARAALPIEERVFLAVMLSVTTSCALTLAMAAFDVYSFNRLLWVLGALCGAIVVGSGFDLRLGRAAARPGWSLLLPAALVAIGLTLYFPPAEWVLGGRDQGVYTNEGVQIAQRGTLITHDPLVAEVPAPLRDLVFPVGPDGRSRRFMGFFILDPAAGTVVGQFPHFFPSSLALGYAVDGLTGVRLTTGVWAILGVLAVYFAGAACLGRTTAAAAAGLLSVSVAQVWFARSPNAEVAFQALVFAALYAYARMETAGRAFFALVAATFLGVLLFLRVDGFLVLAVVAGAVLLGAARGQRPSAMFLVPLFGWAAAGAAYLAFVIEPYFDQPRGFVENLGFAEWALIGLVAAAAAAVAVAVRRRHLGTPVWLPAAIVAFVTAAAAYAYFFREPGGRLAPHDASALRTVTEYYLTPYLLAAALAGYALVVPRVFWRHSLLILLATGFSLFFFYKIRIVPEHYWMARRFLPVILPAMLLFAGAAAFYTPWRLSGSGPAWASRLRTSAGIVMVAAAAWHFFEQSKPILSHVEYAGVVPRLERLAAQIGDDDLAIIESRGASDLHVLGLPLAYIYARPVLVLSSDRPQPARFAKLIEWAARRYRRVLYLGSGSRALLSRDVDAEFIAGNDFSVPEYERTWGRAPREARQKAFTFGLWRFVPLPQVPLHARVEVGGADDFAVSGFWPKEANDRYRFRWSKAEASVSLRLPATAPSEVTLWLGNGGRPPGTPEPRASVYVDGELAGVVDVTSPEPEAYSVRLPPGTIDRAMRRSGFILISLETTTWSPRTTRGVDDDRELGVMATVVELR